MTTPLLSVDHLSFRVGKRVLVDDVSFSANRGEVTIVIGPNGAGKTSLLETLVGLRAASTGTVRVDGRPTRLFTDYARAFSYLPDQAELPAETRVGRIVDHALAHAQRSSDLGALSRALDIESLLPRPAGVLSRGERQRVALFSALALSRPIAVLDEPFSAFDPLQLRDVLAAVRSVADSGVAIVASVHQLADADKIADRVLLMADGRTVAFGTLASLREQTGDAAATLEQVFFNLLARKHHVA